MRHYTNACFGLNPTLNAWTACLMINWSVVNACRPSLRIYLLMRIRKILELRIYHPSSLILSLCSIRKINHILRNVIVWPGLITKKMIKNLWSPANITGGWPKESKKGRKTPVRRLHGLGKHDLTTSLILIYLMSKNPSFRDGRRSCWINCF